MVLFGSLTRSTSAPFQAGYLHNVVALSGRLCFPLAFRLPAQSLPELSMGMTDDFEAAIEAGATLVRIGRAIFGERA